MPYVTLAILWFIFTVGAVVAGIACIPALLLGKTRYARNVLHALDCVMAAFLGWKGDETVSKECGRDTSCRFCKIICKILHYTLEKNHCEKEGAK